MAGLNMDKINNRIVKSVTPEEALDKIDPITWPEEVLPGEKKVIVTNAEKGQSCIRLETLL